MTAESKKLQTKIVRDGATQWLDVVDSTVAGPRIVDHAIWSDAFIAHEQREVIRQLVAAIRKTGWVGPNAALGVALAEADHFID